MTTISSIDARYAQDQVGIASKSVTASVQNLVSGAKRDANVADLSVGTVLAARVGTLRVTVGNAGQAKSLLETAKGSLDTILSLLQKQKNLAVKAADDSLSNNERGFLDQEFQSIVSEIDRIASTSNFNGKALLDGSISGVAAVNTDTTESVENYSLTATGKFLLGGTFTAGNLVATASAFTSTAAGSVGYSRTENHLNFGTISTTGSATITIAGQAITFSTGATAITAATAFVAAAHADQIADSSSNNLRNLVITDNLDGTVNIKSAFNGTDQDVYTVALTTDPGIATITLGGGTVDGATTKALNFGTVISQGAARTVSAAETTYDENLLGAITDITGTINNDAGEAYAVFTATVNGTQYTSQPVYLLNNGVTSSVIQSGQVITFEDLNGAKNAGGFYTDNSFNLVIGTSDVVLAGATLPLKQVSLDTVCSGFETQLAGTKLMQDRNPNLENVSSSDFKIASAIGTVFSGILGYNPTGAGSQGTVGDIVLRSDGFGDTGDYGSIGAFSFDRDTGILTTTVDGVEYSADLSSTDSSTLTTTGQGYISTTAYVPSTKVFTFTGNTIVLATADTTDGRQLRIGLSNVTTTTLALTSDDGATNFENAFNNLFGVAQNESLSFQVGAASTDTIGVSLDSAQTSNLYKDADGIARTLSVANIDDAIEAGNVLDLAIRATISLISTVSAKQTSFDSAIQNNQASIQNADAARSKLLDTDYTAESTKFAEARVRVDAATSVLAQVNTRIQNLLQLLRQ